MRLSQLHFDYPPELVALYPADKRTGSRMMVLDRMARSWAHSQFSQIIDYFKSGDVLVMNNSKVFPCRLISTRKTGGKMECFLVRELEPQVWECLLSSSKKTPAGTIFEFAPDLSGEILDDHGETRQIKLISSQNIWKVLDEVGHVPLPPYIKRTDEASLDKPRYQTVYAQHVGSVAAPTAGFHFSLELLEALKAKGVEICFVTLHVGLGTFLPVRVDDLSQHQMHAEFFDIPPETAAIINRAKHEKRRVTAVGTTSVRTLESAWQPGEGLKAGSAWSKKFIYPPYEFQVVDRMLTNFHQPESTLLALVGAFAGLDFVLEAYREAIKNEYRLFSYGDCMLIQ